MISGSLTHRAKSQIDGDTVRDPIPIQHMNLIFRRRDAISSTMRKSLQKRDANLCKVIARRNARKYISKKKILYKRNDWVWPGKRQSTRVSVPVSINVCSIPNRKDTIRFFAKMRSSAFSGNSIILDFSRTKFLTAPGMLLFIAEVDRIKRIMGDKFDFRISNLKENVVRQVLIQIGFFDLCGYATDKISRKGFREDTRHWQFASGERVDDEANAAFDRIEGRIAKAAFKGIWKGLSEALVNSVQHAYLQPRGTNGPPMNLKRWWMFTQERDGKLTIAVCDLGIGIPRSLPLNWRDSVLSQIASKIASTGPDVRAVRTALEVGKTRTMEGHRGRGLPEIWQAVRNFDGSGILIHSNHARLAWNAEERQEHEREFSNSVSGTLVMWTVPTIDGEEMKNVN